MPNMDELLKQQEEEEFHEQIWLEAYKAAIPTSQSCKHVADKCLAEFKETFKKV